MGIFKKYVWLASYPKSGNTWFRMFLSNYLSDSKEALDLENIHKDGIFSATGVFEEVFNVNPFELTDDEIDLYRPDLFRYLSKNDDEKSIVYKKAHDAYTLNIHNEPIFPTEVSKAAIYFVRNPFDVTVSYANHNSQSIEKTIKRLIDTNSTMGNSKTGQFSQKLMTWGEHYFSWKEQENIPVVIVRYEDMKLDTYNTFSKILEFVGLEVNESKLKRAIENSSFNVLSSLEKKDGFSEKPQGSAGFFRKGEIGDYRNHLDQAQIDLIIEHNHKALNDLNYLDENNKLTV